jgi:uncharacterized membrane protein
MNAIISLITKYPHLVVCFFLAIFIAITQSYYGKKMYYSKDIKYRKQYRIMHIISCVMLLILFVFTIASSTETIYTGFPYDKIIPELLNPQINLEAVAQNYYDYYNGLYIYPSGYRRKLLDFFH